MIKSAKFNQRSNFSNLKKSSQNMMGENNESGIWENPSLIGEGGINIFLPFPADQLQQLKDYLQDQTNFAFHDIAPLFCNIVIEEEVPPS